MKRPP